MAPEYSRNRCPAGPLPIRLGAPAVLCLAGLLLAPPAQASFLYVCQYKGHTISGGQPPPECKEQDIRELNPDGTLHRLIPAPLTREQRRKREQEEEEHLREQEAERAQARKDRALLETYGSVSEIEAARQRTVAARQVLVDRAQQRIEQYARERKKLDDEAEFYAKREMPAKLKEAFAANAALSAQQEKTKTDVLQEIRALNERYDADAQRYRQLEEMAARAAAAREREGAGTPDPNSPQ